MGALISFSVAEFVYAIILSTVHFVDVILAAFSGNPGVSPCSTTDLKILETKSGSFLLRNL